MTCRAAATPPRLAIGRLRGRAPIGPPGGTLSPRPDSARPRARATEYWCQAGHWTPGAASMMFVSNTRQINLLPLHSNF